MSTQPADILEPTRVPRRVLVVDDDEVIRSLVRDGLEREGFEVSVAGDGESALRRLGEEAPDLIVLDVNLPAIGGFDVLTAIRASSEVPVILLTGRVDEVDRVLGLELGADDYVMKPFSPRELASRARAILRRVAPDAKRALDFGDLRIDVK
ncbi:MAG: two-component system, OmpR family, alkaline phosphatase synthesis response regulator PhoP, partial [Actinomycetota bacterium]|nr:two-component system, OmpR family, alkaline phosphatase synthesis response regulator PhoP [Actinomycetota bacterium]